MLDGMDSFIYALVLVPALRELLPRSGISPSNANIGYYGGVLFALFLVGWGMALLWGPIADRFGRVRTLMLTIICFSLFTLLSAFATNIWTLAALRLLAGIGIGGEWAMGATLISEEWPEDRRTMGAGMMHTGYYFGFFLAALANYFVGSRFGWRWMFVVGGVPALLVILIRKGMREPARWESKRGPRGDKWSLKRTFLEIFSPRYRLRTFLNLMYQLVSTIGLWAGSVYVPAAITYLAARAGHTSFEAARLASYGTAILSIRTILGALSVPAISGDFLFADGRGHRCHIRIRFLFAERRAEMVFCVPVFSRNWRSELHRLFFLAAGTVRNRMPRQRAGVCAKCGTFCRRRRDVSCRNGSATLSDPWHSCGADGDCFCCRAFAVAVWRGNEGQAFASLIRIMFVRI